MEKIFVLTVTEKGDTQYQAGFRQLDVATGAANGWTDFGFKAQVGVIELFDSADEKGFRDAIDRALYDRAIGKLSVQEVDVLKKIGL